MKKYRQKTVRAKLFELGMEDGFKYHIQMFGLFNKQECIRAGFTPDFEKDKIPFINTPNGDIGVTVGEHYIVTDSRGDRYPVKKEVFEELYDEENIKVTIATHDDWEGLYVNGKLEVEGHRIRRHEYVELINKYKVFDKIVNVELSDDCLDEYGECPMDLDSVF